MTNQPALTIKVKIDRIRQAEAQGHRPPGYADAVLAKAYHVGEKWAKFDEHTYRALAEQHEAHAALAHLDGKRIAAEAPPNRGPGTVLKLAIKAVTGVDPGSNCACNKRVRTMNRWGWWGCWKQRRTIAGWLAEEADKRGHTVDPDRALSLLKAAWKAYRQKKD